MAKPIGMRQVKRKIKRFFLSLFYRKLWVQLASILLVIVIVPQIFLGVLLISASQEAVKKEVLNSYKEIVTRAASEIKLFVKGPENLLTTTAAMLTVTNVEPWKQETILVELVLEQPIFMRVSSLDLSGKEIATSDLGRKFPLNYSKQVLDVVRENNTYISKVKILNNHIPYLTMAVPVKRKREVTGIVVADINLRGMWDIVDNIRLGKTGRAFLVSGEGTLIAHQDKKRVLKNENLKYRQDVRAVLAGRKEAVELESELGKKWICAYAPIPGFSWGIVLKQEQEEAYLSSKAMKKQSWLIIILSGLAAFWISIGMAKVLVRPIKALVLRIKRVADGDLEQKVEIRRRDEIGELIRSFNDMTKKLKKAKRLQRLSAIGEVTARTAHEFKNSLVPIKAFVQLLPKRYKEEGFIDKFNSIVPGEIERCERIIKVFSDFSSHYELKITKINLKELIDDILKIRNEEFKEKKIKASYHCLGDNPYIFADRERLRQVFTNLIINAIGAMPSGGSLTIETQIRTDKELVTIKVKDAGGGIAPDMLGKIFEPFQTSKEGGMGLGLAIVRKIVEQHYGNIKVESKIGVGTTFIVELPLKHV